MTKMDDFSSQLGIINFLLNVSFGIVTLLVINQEPQTRCFRPKRGQKTRKCEKSDIQFHLLYRINIWGHFNLIPINRVNNAISNTYRFTYKCHTFLETSGQGLPILPHLGLIKGGNFNPTPIDGVNKSISNNIRLTYQCYILL